VSPIRLASWSCAGALCCLAVTARAQSDADVPKLRIGHYSSGDGLRGLVLDRTGPVPLAKLDGDEEVLALLQGNRFADRRGARWTSLTADTEQPFLEVSEYGQVRLAATEREGAIPLHRDADGEPLGRASQPAPKLLATECSDLSARVARSVGTTVALSATPKEGEDLTAFEGAVVNAARALERVGDSQIGKRALRKLSAIEVRAGDAVKVQVSGARAQVSVVPSKGLAGRPSSSLIQKVLEANL
jgi:hypothetical protein